MTYQKLLNQLKVLTPEQLQQDISIVNPDGEYLEVESIGITTECDVLDDGHIYLQCRDVLAPLDEYGVLEY